MDYTIFYKEKYGNLSDFVKENNKYSLFISSFNDSERVRSAFDEVSADQKIWLILPEYHYEESELPTESENVKVFMVSPDNADESNIIRIFFDEYKIMSHDNICVDLTGFLRPHLIFMVRYLKAIGSKTLDFIYCDPNQYAGKEKTKFSSNFLNVQTIRGCEGVHDPDTSNDFLIIGSGYDNNRIADVSKDKKYATKIQLFGFPSLRPDMFQENVLKAYKAEEDSTGGDYTFIESETSLLAPANDPFVTAQVLREFVIRENKKRKITNLYLSPLSTKAQTLGFALYYSFECVGENVSVIFPYYDSYSRETSIGISKIWKYTVEF